MVRFGVFWCIFRSECVLKNSPKINIILYKNKYCKGFSSPNYTLAMGYLTPGEIFENMLQSGPF